MIQAPGLHTFTQYNNPFFKISLHAHSCCRCICHKATQSERKKPSTTMSVSATALHSLCCCLFVCFIFVSGRFVKERKRQCVFTWFVWWGSVFSLWQNTDSDSAVLISMGDIFHQPYREWPHSFRFFFKNILHSIYVLMHSVKLGGTPRLFLPLGKFSIWGTRCDPSGKGRTAEDVVGPVVQSHALQSGWQRNNGFSFYRHLITWNKTTASSHFFFRGFDSYLVRWSLRASSTKLRMFY